MARSTTHHSLYKILTYFSFYSLFVANLWNHGITPEKPRGVAFLALYTKIY